MELINNNFNNQYNLFTNNLNLNLFYQKMVLSYQKSVKFINKKNLYLNMIKNKELIYKTFFDTKEKKLYYNQIKDITKLSHSSLQIVLKKLIENQELKEEKTKGNVFYSLTKKYKAIEFAKITTDKINNLNLNVKVPIKDFIKLIPQNIYTCILFGSASRNQEKENSDIDLLVVLYNFENKKLDKLYMTEIKILINQIKDEIETRSAYPISVAYVSKEEFDKQKDYLVQQATNTGFPIINQMNYYEEF